MRLLIGASLKCNGSLGGEAIVLCCQGLCTGDQGTQVLHG